MNYAIATKEAMTAYGLAKWHNSLVGEKVQIKYPSGAIDEWTVEEVISLSIIPAGNGLASPVAIVRLDNPQGITRSDGRRVR